MPSKEELLALAERVERASGPDRELDHRCFAALHGWDYPLGPAALNEYEVLEEPSFTASLDAAMTLVPEGWHVGRFQQLWRTRCWTAELAPLPSGELLEALNAGRTIGWVTADCISAATAALALTAVALRARALSENNHE